MKFVVNRHRALSGLATVAVVGTLFVAQSVVAQAKCNPGRSNNGANGQVGWYNQLGSTVGGVGANIYDYSPWVNYPNVTAWTMVSRGGTTWAQVGWEENPYNIRYTFDQWTHDGTYSENDFFGSAAGQTHRYTTLYGNIPGDFSFLYDGGLLDYETAQWVPIYG